MRILKSDKLLADLIAQIRTGELADGMRLPTHRELARTRRVSLSVVNRAYRELQRQGLTIPAGRSGTIVRLATPAVTARQSRMERPPPDRVIDLTHNYAVLPELNEAIKSLYAAAVVERWDDVTRPAAEELVTAAGRGWMSLIGIAPSGLAVIGSAGGQHGILACLLAFVGSGDRIAVDPFTYTGLKLAASTLGIGLVAVSRDDDGLKPAALDRAAQDHGITAVYLMPSFHNPLGTAMPAARRKQLAAVARKRKLFVIEDDPHRYLTRSPIPSFVELVPDLSAHVTTMSKILGPQIRLGFVFTAASNAIRLQLAHRSANWTLPAVEAAVVVSALDRLLPQYIRRLQTVALRRQNLAREHLANHDIVSDRCAPHLCVPLKHNWKSAQFGYVATTRGLKVSPGIAYSADNAADSAFEFVRVSLMSEPDEGRLITALGRLDALASASPTAFLDAS